MRKFLQKLKSNKGATGADVVVALSVIVVGMAVVSMIYISLSNGGKRVTRTSGATRIAVNILENIERLDYTKFEYELGKLAYPYLTKLNTSDPEAKQLADIQKNLSNVIGQLKSDEAGKDKKIEISKNTQVRLNSATDNLTNVTYDEIFGTKIPNGYDYTITVSSAPPGKDTYPFDLCARIIVKVTFDVDGREENVTLQTVKYRELYEECNKPDMSMTMSANNATKATQAEAKGYLVNNAFPVKISNSDHNRLVRCDVNDEEWYNYRNKQWAMVYDAGRDNLNATEAGKQRDLSFSENISKIKVWIPRYGSVTSNGFTVYSFAYAHTVYPLYKLSIPSLMKKEEGASQNEDELLIYCPMTFNELPDTFKLADTGKFGLNDGVWVKYTYLTQLSSGITNNDILKNVNLAKGLLNTQYGFQP